jgi:hypothetical protein
MNDTPFAVETSGLTAADESINLSAAAPDQGGGAEAPEATWPRRHRHRARGPTREGENHPPPSAIDDSVELPTRPDRICADSQSAPMTQMTWPVLTVSPGATESSETRPDRCA